MAASLDKRMFLRKFRQVQNKNSNPAAAGAVMLLLFCFVHAIIKQKEKEKENLVIWNPPDLKKWLVRCSLQQPTAASSSPWTGKKPLLPYAAAFKLNIRFHALLGFKAHEVSVLQISH